VDTWLQEDVDEIARQLEKEKEEVKGQMLEELKDRKRRLEDERNNNDLVEDSRSSGWRKSVRGKKADPDRKSQAQSDRSVYLCCVARAGSRSHVIWAYGVHSLTDIMASTHFSTGARPTASSCWQKSSFMFFRAIL
jgi:hypothetical protein